MKFAINIIKQYKSIVVLFFFVVLMFYTPAFWMDEAWDTAVGWSWINLGKFGNPTYPLDGLDEVFFLHPPLPIILESVLIKLFGITPWVVKFWPITIGILGLFVFYLLAKELFNNEKIALFGTIYLAFIPLYLIITLQFRPEIFVLFFTILTVYFIVLAEKRQNLALYFLAGISSALSFLSHFYGGFLILAVGLYLIIEWFKQKNPNILKFLLFFILGVTIIVVPYFIWILKHWEIFKIQYSGNLSNLGGLQSLLNNILQEKHRYLNSPLGSLLILFTIGGLIIFRKKFLKKPFLLCLIYFIVFLLGLASFMPNKTIIYLTPILFITAIVASFLISGDVDIKNKFILFLTKVAGIGSLIVFVGYIILCPPFKGGYINYYQLLHFNQILEKNYNSGIIVGDPTYFLFLPEEVKPRFISEHVLFRWIEENKSKEIVALFKEKDISILVYSDFWWKDWCKSNKEEVCLTLNSILNHYGKIVGEIKRENQSIDYVYKINISNL